MFLFIIGLIGICAFEICVLSLSFYFKLINCLVNEYRQLRACNTEEKHVRNLEAT